MARSTASVASWERTVETLRKLLACRYLPAMIAILAMALTAPSLSKGLVADDLIHRAKLLTLTLPQALRELFVFVDQHNGARLMDLGAGPWWSLKTLHIAFFRPVTVLTHWLDYRLWPDSPALMHAHSIIWYGAVCALAALFYRRLMGFTWVAGLAALLFAVDDAHVVPVAWLANRNTLLAAFFGLLAIVIHDRWRREGWRTGAFLAPLCLALAVLSAETGVAVGAYLLAYALFLDRGTWRQRVGSLMPAVAVLAVWWSVYHYLGYGAWGSEYYVDPGREPLRFAAAVVERGPILLLRQWVWPSSGFYSMLSMPASRLFWGISLFVIALVVIVLLPLIRGDRVARFWAAGMVLAIVPICAKDATEGATLVFVGFGAMGLIAQFIAGLLDKAGWLPAHRAWRVSAWMLCALLVGLHVVRAPIQLVAGSMGPDPFGAAVERFSNIGPLPDAAQHDVVIVNAPSPLSFGYLQDLRSLRNQPMPAHIRTLAPGYFSVEVARLDSHTVVVRPENGYLAPPGEGEHWDSLPFLHLVYTIQRLDRVCRSEAFPMSLGERVELTGMCAKVTAMTHDRRPAEATIRFALPLDDPSLVWLQWDWKKWAYVPFALPPVGHTVRIPGLV